jgi:hypothetical protein
MAGMPEHEFLLSGERAALGLLDRRHLPQLSAWFNDPETRRGLAHRGLVNEEAEGRWYEEVLGLRNVMLESYAFNEQAIRAYERAGFRVVGRRRDCVLALGRRWDSILLDAAAGDFDSPLQARLQPEE